MLNGKIKTFFHGEFLIILTAVLWGVISLFSRPLNDYGFSSAEITFVRSLLSVGFLGVFLLLKDKSCFKVALRDVPLLLFLGVGCFMTVCLLYTLSIEQNGSSVASMLEYTSSIWTVIISRFVFKEKITFVKIISLVGVLSGCAMLSFGGEMRLTVNGLLFGLGTGLTLAFYGVVSKIATRKYASETITFYMFLFSAFGAFFIATAWNVPLKIANEPASIWYFIGLAALSTTLAYILYTTGLKTVSAGKASMLSSIEIIVAAIVGLVVFHDNIGIIGYVGIAVSICSLIFLEMCDLNQKHNKNLTTETD